MNYEASMDHEDYNDQQQDGPFTDRKLIFDQLSNQKNKKKISMENDKSLDLSQSLGNP